MCRKFLFFLLGAGCMISWGGQAALALRPDQVLVLANRNARASVALAREYMKVRGIPSENLLQLWITDREWCSREDYAAKVVPRVREFLEKKDPLGNIRCLVTMYGLPLKVSPPAMSREERLKLDGLRKEQKALGEKIKGLAPEEKEEKARLQKELGGLKKKILEITKSDYRAAFDSELALVRVKDYPLKGWVPNPLFLGFRKRTLPIPRDRVLMVSRMDGPSEDLVRRVMRESLETEREGLSGTAYFDARWPRPDEEKGKKLGMGYGFYDRSIHLAAERVRKSGRLKVVLNDKPELFQPGECPNAALYCGWYRLARYLDAFDWKPGAVGFHIASSECATLRGKNSQVWCKRMLEDGVAATLGPVAEPYVQAFPIPEVFFGLLVQGKATLGECYILSLPFLSWQMVLVGDPLYRPFAAQDRSRISP